MLRLPFFNREHAAVLLAERLLELLGSTNNRFDESATKSTDQVTLPDRPQDQGRAPPRPLVLAIPRGAVPMARVIADRLGADLDVILVRKLGAPFNEELAIGAVDERGEHWLVPGADAYRGSDKYLADEIQRQSQLIAERRKLYAPHRQPVSPQGRLVIVVDDGLATGATMMMALRAVRRHGPQRLVCATPVASQEALEQVKRLADDVVCLATPAFFGAVGRYYEHFEPVDDAEVQTALMSTQHDNA